MFLCSSSEVLFGVSQTERGIGSECIVDHVLKDCNYELLYGK